ncbi:FMN-binding protein [Streptomyces sp. NPDC004065]|uniref:FMN-binding protein n=1 Tax=Streptomyces sp. NPDC004065 TaxID=3364689 RepID=UPI00384B3D90
MHALSKRSPLRRAVLAGAATVSGLVMLLSLKPHTPPETTAAPAPVPSSGPGAITGSGGSTGPAGPGGAQGPGGSSSGGKARVSGTYTGETAQTRWGPVQVRITVEKGRITDVTAVAYPTGNPRDQEINGYAVPRLRGEALTAQSAGIDAVSGATYTSDGYKRSLQSALDSAGL